MIVTGDVLNHLVLISNGDRFPVLINERQLRNENEGRKNVDFEKDGMIDNEHFPMTKDTHLNFLGDIIDIGSETLSIGDLLIEGGEWIWELAPYLWGSLLVLKVTKEEFIGDKRGIWI